MQPAFRQSSVQSGIQIGVPGRKISQLNTTEARADSINVAFESLEGVRIGSHMFLLCSYSVEANAIRILCCRLAFKPLQSER